MDMVRVSETLAYCGQPSFQALRSLRKSGFHTLVNVRLLDEQPADEAEQAARVGLAYLHFPVAQPDWTIGVFERFAAVMRQRATPPALVHSGQGARAGILCITLRAAESGWTAGELDVQARRLGLELPDAARAWLRRHGKAYEPHRQVEHWLSGGQLP